MRIFSFIMLLVFLSAGPVFADSKESLVKKGKAGFEKKDYAGSLKFFEKALKKDPESPEINFNAGTAGYKAGKYDEAAEYLQKGLLSTDKKVRRDSHFNLGDVYYSKAVQQENSAPTEALSFAKKAKNEFESVLNIDDKDQDARYNYDAAVNKIKEIEKKLPKSKGQQNNKDDQQNEDKNKEQNVKESGENKQEQDNNKKSTEEKDTAKDQNKSEKSGDTKEGKKEQKEDNSKEEQGFSRSLGDKEKNETSEKQDRHGIKPGQMDKEEARSLIRQFEQSNEATGLLNFDKKSSAEEKPVLKDW